METFCFLLNTFFYTVFTILKNLISFQKPRLRKKIKGKRISITQERYLIFIDHQRSQNSYIKQKNQKGKGGYFGRLCSGTQYSKNIQVNIFTTILHNREKLKVFLFTNRKFYSINMQKINFKVKIYFSSQHI